MTRGSGAGLMGFGIVLVVVGAIMDFAVTATAKGFSVHTVGAILLFAGIGVFIVGLLVVLLGRSSRTTVREDVHATPSGQERVVEERDNLAP